MGHARSYFFRILSATSLAVAAASTLSHAGQANRQAKVPVEVSLKVGQGTYQAKGPGTCTHAPQAAT